MAINGKPREITQGSTCYSSKPQKCVPTTNPFTVIPRSSDAQVMKGGSHREEGVYSLGSMAATLLGIYERIRPERVDRPERTCTSRIKSHSLDWFWLRACKAQKVCSRKEDLARLLDLKGLTPLRRGSFAAWYSAVFSSLFAAYSSRKSRLNSKEYFISNLIETWECQCGRPQQLNSAQDPGIQSGRHNFKPQ